jgi:hypothetical protein
VPEPTEQVGDWAALERELDAWAAAGDLATLWWRDDDAQAPGVALERLLAIAERSELQVGLAAIPALATDDLFERLDDAPAVVLQHGWRHFDHAGRGEKKSELGPQRPRDEVLADIARGAQCLQRRAGLVEILVPPWNRIRSDVLDALVPLGIRGLSTFEPRGSARPAPGLSQTNTHVDIIDWRAGRGFRGEAGVLRDLVAHLASRRSGAVDGREPTGILSHHRVHDERCWSFLAELFRLTSVHPAVRWLEPLRAVLGGCA